MWIYLTWLNFTLFTNIWRWSSLGQNVLESYGLSLWWFVRGMLVVRKGQSLSHGKVREPKIVNEYKQFIWVQQLVGSWYSSCYKAWRDEGKEDDREGERVRTAKGKKQNKSCLDERRQQTELPNLTRRSWVRVSLEYWTNMKFTPFSEFDLVIEM